MKKIVEIVLPVVIAAVLGFVIYQQIIRPEIPPNAPQAKAVTIGNTEGFFAATLTDSAEASQPLAQYKGKTLIVNFWATWCPPCREEMPDLSALHEALSAENLVVLGLAVDELEAVQSFQSETPVSYPLLIAMDEGMSLGSQLGNKKGVLPFTAIINTQGEVTQVFYGKVNQSMIKQALGM